MEMKATLEANSFVHIKGSTMKRMLKYFGASDEDLSLLESGYVHERVARDPHPVMSHRQNAIHRMLIDTANNHISSADTHACVQIPRKEVASSCEEGSKIDFRRHGTRWQTMAPDCYAQSTVPRAMAAINMRLLPEFHHPQDNLNIRHNVTINDQALIRIQRDVAKHDVSFSPTPEGIHQDNTEVSTVTLVGRYNITEGGESRLWRLEALTGNYDEEDFKAGKMEDNLLFNQALEDPWETLVFNDRKIKHEARAFSGGKTTTRDVIVNFMRKPLADGKDVKLRFEEFVPV